MKGTEKQVKWAKDIITREIAKLDAKIAKEEENRATMLRCVSGNTDPTSIQWAAAITNETSIEMDMLVAYRQAKEYLLNEVMLKADAKAIIENRYCVGDNVSGIVNYALKKGREVRAK